LFAAEHVERQETVIPIVTVEVRARLFAMHAIVRGVEVQDQFGRRDTKRGDELVHKNPVHRPGSGAVGPVLQPAERGTGSQRFDLLDGGLPDRIVTERVVIIQVFVAVAQAVEALAQERKLGVFDEGRGARIGQDLGQRFGQAEPTIQLA
jgi:hypothetical protein